MLTRTAVALMVCCGALSACDEVEEQEPPSAPAPPVDPGPNAFVLAPGFAPDPQLQTGTAGGPVEASQRYPGCAGWIAQAANHTLVLSAPIRHLRLVAHSPADTTLLVVRADGSHLCDDDYEGSSPMVEGPFLAGTHQVFVGTHHVGPDARYSLGVSQGVAMQPSSVAVVIRTLGRPPPPPSPPGSAPPPGMPAGEQPPVFLEPGFEPDPHVQMSWAEGATPASTMGPHCGGHIPLAPQHSFVLTRTFTDLRIAVGAAIDTTLVVRGSGGVVHCNDDSDGVNPVVEGELAAGAYSVFVGTHEEGQGGSYRIGFTTRAELTGAQLVTLLPSSGAFPPPGGASGSPTRSVPGMMPGDMRPQGLTPAQQASADANGISYHEARELHRCRACLRDNDFDHCIYECRESCLNCLASGASSEQACGPPCGGRR